MSTQKSIQPTFNRLKSIDGAWYMNKDEKILDLSGQTLNLSLGQPPERIKKAVINQIKDSVFFSSRFGSQVFDDLSLLLTKYSPKNITGVNHKLSDGSDAVETAIKLGFENTRTMNIIALKDAWHGETMLTLQLSSNLRSKYLGANLNVEFAKDNSLESLILKVENTKIPSVVIIDPIGFSIGLFEYDEIQSLLPKLREICIKQGHFLIFDEIQCFGGYLNGKFFSYDLFNVECDAITIGKALGQGFPISACLYSENTAELLYNEAEFTYGGQPPACAAAIEGIHYLIDNEVDINKSLDLWNKFIKNIEPMFNSLDYKIRKIGFIVSITPNNRDVVESLIISLYDLGLIVRRGNLGKSILLKAPITFSQDMYDWSIHSFKESIKKIKNINYSKDYIFFQNENILQLKDTFRIEGFSVKERTGSEQYELAILLDKIGVPVPSFIQNGKTLKYKRFDGVALSQYKIKNIREVKSILSQVIDFIVKSHSNNLLIGNRTVSNTVWDGVKIKFINFSIENTGDKSLIKAFEHLFILLNHAELIPNDFNRDYILRPYIYEYKYIYSHLNIRELVQRFDSSKIYTNINFVNIMKII